MDSQNRATCSYCAERYQKLEDRVRELEEGQEGAGNTLDHLVNTMDSIVIPKLNNHQEKIDAHEAVTKDAHDFITSQRGAWAFVSKAAVVIAAGASVATLVLKLKGM